MFSIYRNIITKVCLIVICTPNLIAQVNQGFGLSDSPGTPSPSSSALGKVAEMPINLSTGVVNVTIPIYQAKSQTINLPVALNYQTGGIKVNDVATQVGLGWSLNAGGVITRVVRGRPDDIYETGSYPKSLGYSTSWFGYQGKGKEVEEFILNPYKTTSDHTDYSRNFLSGKWDSEPDVYYFNFMGRSGKFFLNKDGEAILVPQQDLKIKRSEGDPLYSPLDHTKTEWVIITSDGTRFLFGTNDLIVDVSNPKCVELTEVTTERLTGISNCFEPGQSKETYASSWFLREIISSNGNSEMTFTYKQNTNNSFSYQFITKNKYDHLKDNNGAPKCGESIKNSINNIYYIYTTIKILNPVYLSEINTAQGKLIFSYNARDDIQKGLKLNDIEVKDNNNNSLRKFNLIYSYFPSPTSKRLKLEGIAENGVVAYKFDYNSTTLPDRNSSSIDYWGYSNGAAGSVFQGIPGVTFKENTGLKDCSAEPFCEFPGAERSANLVFSQGCILNKITYPGGGTSEYFYDLNKFLDKDGVEQIWGGLRIASVRVSDGINNSNSLTTNYAYSFQEGVNKGKSSGTLDEIYSLQHRRYYKVLIVQEGTEIPIPGNTSHFLLRSSEPINTADFSVGDQLIYKSVTVSQAGNGKTVYSFTSHAPPDVTQDPDSDIKIDRVDHRDIKSEKFALSGNLKYDYFEPPFFQLPNTSRSWERGLTTDIKVYNEQGKIRSWQHYEYEFNSSLFPMTTIEGVVVYSKAFQSYMSGGGLTSSQGSYYGKYKVDSKFYFLSKIVERKYNQNDDTKYIQHIKAFSYNPKNYQVAEVTETDSEGKSKITNYRYSVDYPSNGENIKDGESNSKAVPTGESIGAIPVIASSSSITNEMQIRSMTSQVIETQVWQRKTSTSTKELLAASIVKFDFFPKPLGSKFYNYNMNKSGSWEMGYYYKKTMILPVQSIKVSSNTTLAEANYTQSSVDVNNIFTYDQNKCIIEATNTFDNKIGTSIGVNFRGNINQCVIWDFKNLVPMAKVENATIDKVAFTSFEVDGEMGYWNYPSASITTTDAKTGTKSFAGTVKINTSLSAGAYKLSFWCKGAGSIVISGSSPITSGAEWTYKEILLTNPGALEIATGAVKIDELRIHPENARMVTNVYKPMVGITSSMDVNNVQTFYEYDNNQRLKLTRDDDKNILQQNIYKLGNN